MIGTKTRIAAAALTWLLGAGAAWACDVQGSVVCAGTTDGIGGVTVGFTRNGWTYQAVTDASGTFAVTLPYYDVTSDVSLDFGAGPVPYQTVFIPYGTPSVLAPFEVDVPGCAPPPPPPPVCTAELTEGSFCPSASLGNPKSECKYFGLVPTYKEDNLSGATYAATTDADLAIVKAGSCYSVYVGVTAGEVLAAPYSQGISHVTYCSCPPE